MSIAIITLNKQSIIQARKIVKVHKADIYTMDRYLEDDLLPLTGGLSKSIKYILKKYDVVICIMAMGIIVRQIAPFIKNKCIDPAVICLTIDGKFVIPVLSGHIGGANDYAIKIAETLCATPVISTASDILNKRAVDTIAIDNNLIIDSMKDAMNITSLMIDNVKVQMISNIDISVDNRVVSKKKSLDSKGFIYIGYKTERDFLKPHVWLIPKRLTIGIGAKRNSKFTRIHTLLKNIMSNNKLDIRAIKRVASIDLKKDEKGIIELSKKLNVEFITYSKEDLLKYEDLFESSTFVKKITGVGSVSMPSGYIGSNRGRCLINKTAKDGITISIWEEII